MSHYLYQNILYTVHLSVFARNLRLTYYQVLLKSKLFELEPLELSLFCTQKIVYSVVKRKMFNAL